MIIIFELYLTFLTVKLLLKNQNLFYFNWKKVQFSLTFKQSKKKIETNVLLFPSFILISALMALLMIFFSVRPIILLDFTSSRSCRITSASLDTSVLVALSVSFWYVIDETGLSCR